MKRTIPIELVDHLASAATTTCYLLKVKPRFADLFGITTLDRDVVYDDGSGDGAITYRARRGYTASDQVANSDLSVDNGEANGLLAEYPMDGATKDGINRGDYDGAQFVQYLVNYEDTSQGHAIINSGKVGQVRSVDDLTVVIELRSLNQQLKQNSVIELTSITCRASFGDERCKMELEWVEGTVTSVGAETDRTFGISAVSGDFKIPGVVNWLTGENAGNENEVEEYSAGTVTLLIPTRFPIQVGDGVRIRRDCDKSKAMCRDDYDNLLNMRAEPELPRADGLGLQSPTTVI